MIDVNLLVNELCDQRFYIWDHFLDNEEAHLLRNEALQIIRQREFQAAKIGNLTNTSHNDAIRTDKIHWLDASSPHIQPFWQMITQIKTTLNETLYLGLCEFEVHFAFYEAGTFYRKHIDQFQNKKSRKVSFIYYLNPYWQANFGGQLVLYDEQNKLITSVAPTWNRLICFLSHLPHEVLTTTADRLSITGWLKTKEELVI
ncbi:SM-20-like protein [Legionella busanensis]|uniref:SM-20-like protein n=1 Tax=Legionella busanensis TaxID=190655 RepID=A0A378JHU1_9GAMM|nr:2OG-Fe(II) oxygenase [Legionella busanensis]STX50331.1 SM-20-like protein [Legionella busanensis]